MFDPSSVEKVLRHLLRFGASRADAEDLAQEALLIAWRERATLDPARSLDAWLYGIARNVHRNHARRERRNPTEPAGDRVTAAEPVAIGDVLTLHHALHALPEDQQDLVILHQLEGHTLKATAELLEIPFDTAKDRLKRARVALEAHCGATLDASVQAEAQQTRGTAKLAVATVLAGVLAAIGRPEIAAAAPAAKLIGMKLVAAIAVGALAIGIVVGIAVDRRTREAPRVPTVATREPVPVIATTPPPLPPDPVPPDAAPARTPPADTLAAEAEAIGTIRTTLATKPRDAIALLAAYHRRFPAGQLAEEADLLAIEASVTLGASDARAQIARFRARHPGSLHADRLNELERGLAGPQ